MSDVGIVHFGPGAFHRAHQADYIDRLLGYDPRWGVAAVSLRSGSVIEPLARQHGRYTLAILDAEPSFRTLAAHKAWVGPGEGERVRALLSDAAVKIVSSTVTEKGYCLAGDGTLDFDHPDIVRDLADPSRPVSLVGWLALGLADRRAAGLSPFVSLCCDNMASNGRKLGAAVAAYARRLDPALADWIAGEAAFPDTMVDSITPATDDRLRALVRERGFDDDIPVSREAYAEWVIEDVLPAGSPDLAPAGVTLAADVAAWEKAKLRILNGAHSALAYLGLLIGHETVADAMGDRVLADFVARMIAADVVPTLRPSPLDLDAYAAGILQRFRNPAIRHLLSQIAWDGSQKLPYRLLDTVREALGAGRDVSRLAVPVAAWIRFVETRAGAGVDIVDPLAATLSRVGRSEDAAGGLLALRQIFPEGLAADPRFRLPVLRAVDSLRSAGPHALIQAELADA